MDATPELELKQLKAGLFCLINLLFEGVNHLDVLSSRTIARALNELVQEINTLPSTASEVTIAELVSDVIVGTTETQAEMIEKWRDELAPLMDRAYERAEELDHELAEFTCLSVDGQQWGAVCVRCLEWVFVRPEQAGGALLHSCLGWKFSF